MRRLGAIGAVAIASVFLLEALVRVSGIAAHLYTDPAFEASPDGSYWRYKAGFEGTVLGPTQVRIGRLGSRLVTAEDGAGGPRIAVFGDSITFGQAVPSAATFTAQLEQRLRPRWAGIRVLNFGVQGHSLDMEVAHLAGRLAEAEPDLVVLAFGSDDLDPARAQNYVDRFGYLTKKAFGSSSSVGDSLRAVLRNSHLALAVKDAYLRWPLGRAPDPTSAAERPLAEEAKLGAFRAAIRRFDSLTRGRARVVMCVDLRETPLARALGDVMTTEFPHIEYVPAGAIRDEEELRRLRVPRDGHPNARAHSLYADRLDGPVRQALAALADHP